jgi:hypothetical protein
MQRDSEGQPHTFAGPSGFVFPGIRSAARPLSENPLNAALKHPWGTPLGIGGRDASRNAIAGLISAARAIMGRPKKPEGAKSVLPREHIFKYRVDIRNPSRVVVEAQRGPASKRSVRGQCWR